MKTTVSLLCALALLASATLRLAAAGGPPELLSYQGYLVDANGAPLGVDGSGNPLPSNYDVTFSIFDASTGGTLLWREQQTITVDAGYFSVLLGEGTVVGSDPRPSLSSVFTGIGADERFVGVAVRFEAGGAFADILPRLRLLTSPYAFSASQARSVVNPDGQALITAEGSDVTVAGTLSATSITGSIAAGNLTGVIDAARIPNLNANKITAGQLDDARLSGNIARRNTSNSFTGSNTFSSLTTLSGGARLNDNDLHLRSDTNHGLGWYAGTKSFAGQFPNGPVLYGFSGGGLGTRQGSTERIALQWTHGRNVHAPYQLTVGTPQWATSDYGMRIGSTAVTTAEGFTHSSGFPSIRTLIRYEDRFQFFAPAPSNISSNNSLREERTPVFEWWFGSNQRMRLFHNGGLTISGSLSEGSDRNQKGNMALVSTPEILAKVSGLPIYEWSYLEGGAVRHVGPMAQDFHAAFGLGINETSLAPRDLAGVAVAGLQGLHAKVKEQEAEIADLRDTVSELQAAVAALLEAQNSGQ